LEISLQFIYLLLDQFNVLLEKLDLLVDVLLVLFVFLIAFFLKKKWLICRFLIHKIFRKVKE